MYENYVRLRDERGLTDYQISMDTGISRSTFSEWKSGRSAPKTDKLLKLSEYFDVPLETLVKEQT